MEIGGQHNCKGELQFPEELPPTYMKPIIDFRWSKKLICENMVLTWDCHVFMITYSYYSNLASTFHVFGFIFVLETLEIESSINTLNVPTFEVCKCKWWPHSNLLVWLQAESTCLYVIPPYSTWKCSSNSIFLSKFSMTLRMGGTWS